MNTQNNNLFTSISKEESKNLTTVVNETISFGHNQEKEFRAVDLWNIQRQRRSSLQRRHFA